ncbi:Serine/threonine protein kinase [Kitasatospora sp. MMS16-BH015]|nr:Serine/threonine protein kinase [Kitasatospora sp. MMS16-BH015]
MSTAPGWRLREDETWCFATPPDRPRRAQGWKLHLSTTPDSAPRLLAEATRVLVAAGCAFKFAVTPQVAAELNGVRAVRGQSGKFLTAYPAEDDQLRRLADQLHRATLGLAGAAILSDRRYLPDSAVHYRYGCFAPPHELSDEGFYEGRLRAPDGSSEPDQRNPWFSPPGWAPLPFEHHGTAARPGGPVRLADRYLVHSAIRHSNRGGVYRARDELTGEEVLLKEARPHVGAEPGGRDARSWLRHEAEVLAALAPRRVAPAPREVFESGGHVFLVEDYIDGVSLQRWAADRARQCGGRIPAPELRRLALALAGLIHEVHSAGYVLRDFKPGNVVMAADGTPVLVDLEAAVRPGAPARVTGTRGFTDPAYLEAADRAATPTPPAPGPEADCYALGATLLHVATGINPVLAPDTPPSRPTAERLAALVRTATPAFPALRSLGPLILGLTADRPTRWTLTQATAHLTATPVPRPAPPSSTGLPALLHHADRLLTDGLAELAATLTPEAEYLWARPRALPPGDPCNVQMGAAGILAVLDRAVRCGHTAAEPTLHTTAHWLADRLDRPSRVLPGLYFGRSGAAWALYEAARTLDDQGLADRALDHALHIPLDSHHPDLCHGLAGAGTAQLHLWRATGDKRFAARATECADRLLALDAPPATIDWPLGPEHRRELANATSYGFAHGLAGQAAFLLALGRELDLPGPVEIATAAGHALCAVAAPDGPAAEWPKGPRRTDRPGLDYWCHGAAGIGTFLIRLWQHTGEPAFRAHAERAGAAVHRDRWRLGPGNCHGASGNAELLLDLAEATGEEQHRERAAQTVDCLRVRAAHRDGRAVLPDDTLRELCASYHVGYSGALDFLLRLRHGGRRSWLVDARRPA